MKAKFIVALLVLAFIACFILPLQADEVTTSIDKAKSLYAAGKLSEAVQELNYAIAHIRTAQMDKFKTAFPAALSGWKANDFNADAASMTFLGGGISVARTYEKSDGNSVSITMVTDSPLMSSVMMMISNPMFLGGNKLVTINNEKAVEEWNADDNYGQLQIVLDNKMLITVEGNGVSKDDLYAYAKALNFAKFKELMNN